ncbi:hypothetical protein B0H11DRAFT_2059852, partial [Mycena galericulata]
MEVTLGGFLEGRKVREHRKASGDNATRGYAANQPLQGRWYGQVAFEEAAHIMGGFIPLSTGVGDRRPHLPAQFAELREGIVNVRLAIEIWIRGVPRGAAGKQVFGACLVRPVSCVHQVHVVGEQLVKAGRKTRIAALLSKGKTLEDVGHVEECVSRSERYFIELF